MDSASLASITTGISDTMSLYYIIGGTILVVMAGIWAFNRVYFVLDSNEDEDYSNYKERIKYDGDHGNWMP